MHSVAARQSAGEALSRHAWGDAYTVLSAADGQHPLDPDDLERLALAAHMTGRDTESDEVWARAHHAWLSRGEVPRAVRCVFWLGLDLVLSGEWSRSTGWMARGRRLLDAERPGCVEEGYLLALEGLQSHFSGDTANAKAVAERALACATRFGDRDLLAFAMVTVGESLIRLGEVGEGVELLDEAMVAVTAGEVSPVVSGLAYCAVIAACHEIFDLRRAREWTAELSRWCASQQRVVPYRGVCLAHRIEIMRLHGDWADALDEAGHACRWLRSMPTARSADAAYYQLGELHRLLGEHGKADQAYREASRLGHTAQPGLALVLLAAGDVRAAVHAIRTALDGAGDQASRCRILPAYIEIMLAAGRTEDARTAEEELAAVAETLDAPLLNAISAQAKGSVLLAAGEARGAQAVLGRAVATFRELDAPYDAARARLLIGLSCRETGDEITARLEIEAAKSVFRELGAAPDLLRAEQLALKAETRAASLLTAREREVLRHLAVGKSNRAIADDLFLSEKTVARHLSNIFVKLGVSSRSAATAYAHQHGLV
ncbi:MULTISPECIES: response regulator transcription factor [unclassified Streptomyces]|uniref:helix-turn-helix transcriptional regulator n=1 Tax=unclassified Streptomyces TaxID=2593676 RepID=UPI002DDBAA80|nr:response regulator transcription factor [Streptomyces sp. NBC_01750]WSB01855.1 response regulator transcription factor [Streptomyces sp. NBC_01794]WSD33896.1 response regulator transcription factor [Streptomyces sp. NBC_01750]